MAGDFLAIEEKETQIMITVQTRDRLKNYYEHGDDTYDIVLNRVLDFWDKHNKK